jgi:carboxymethylenebutenolidase
MSETIEIGKNLHGALATPKGATGPGLVLIHEWHGLTPGVRTLVDRFAAEGFVVLAPDLYHGAIAKDDAHAASLMQAMKTEDAMHDVAAAVAALKARGCAKVGIVGFCMGGAMAFAAASAVEGLSCAVPFYGVPRPDYWHADKMRVPIQAHFARVDEWAKADKAEALAKAVNAHGGRMELFVYDAGHAFMREGDPKAYDAAAAKTAWPRAVTFLHAELG